MIPVAAPSSDARADTASKCSYRLQGLSLSLSLSLSRIGLHAAPTGAAPVPAGRDLIYTAQIHCQA